LKKSTKGSRRIWLNALLIVFTIALVLYLGATNGSIEDAWMALISAKPFWVLCAFGAWCVFVLFETLVLHVFLRLQHIPVRFGSSLIVSLIGMFYSNITPGASGGQPMQVYAFKKRGVPSGFTSSGLAVKFFCFQTALLLSTAVLWFLNRDFVRPHIATSRWFVYYGIALNSLGVIAVVLLAINKNVVRGFITIILKIGAKVRLIRDLPRTASRMDATLEDFNGSVSMLVHHPFHLLLLLGLSLIQIAGLMGGLYFVARAVGVDAYSYWELTTLQHLLYMGAAFTPLPGGSGAQEGGFYLFFQNIFPADTLLAALLLWRFFNYYFSLVITLVFGVVLDSSLSMRGKIRKVQFEGAAAVRDLATDDEEDDENGEN